MNEKIDTEEMFEKIKKQNGEEFAKVLRANVLLDIPNLKHILEFAGSNPKDAENLVSVLKEIREKSRKPRDAEQKEEIKDPIKLLSEAGYDAFYVNSLSQQNSIEKYFEPNERLCTFEDPDRYKKYYIIHAVKKKVKKIKRSKHPEREDEYGTSVISIQIAKAGGFISIKNRYNHTVNNPDATFDNNPDNIIQGLTAALKHKFGVDFMICQGASMPENYRFVHDQLVRFNYEVDNVYYGDKYYFEGSEITKLSTDYEVMLDTVILNTKTGKVGVHKDLAYNGNSAEASRYLMKVLNDEISGHKVNREKDKKTGETIINIIDENKNVKELARTKNGCITSIHLYKTSEIKKDLLYDNKTLREFYAPKLKKIGSYFFSGVSNSYKRNLIKLYVPELEQIGEGCFADLISLSELNAPKLRIVHNDCFSNVRNLRKLYIPELEQIGRRCFGFLCSLLELNAPKLREIGSDSFYMAEKLKKISLPELLHMETECFYGIKSLQKIELPKLKEMKGCFGSSGNIERLFAPELEKVEDGFVMMTKTIRNLYAPKLKITENTPQCIRKAIKRKQLKDGIIKALRLPRRDNKKNVVGSQKVRE